jgi:hypothetical protein
MTIPKKLYDPITTVTAYIAGRHPALDDDGFRCRLRDLLAEYGADDAVLIGVEEGEV